MPRPRHTELSILRQELVSALSAQDDARSKQRDAQAALDRIVRAKPKGTAELERWRDQVTEATGALDEATERWTRSVIDARNATGLYIVAELDNPRERAMLDRLVRQAPGLRSDRQLLDDRRSQWAADGFSRPRTPDA